MTVSRRRLQELIYTVALIQVRQAKLGRGRAIPSLARTKTVLAEGFNQSLKHAKAKSPQVCFFAKDELGTGPVTFIVTPINSLGQRGQPLTASRG